MRRNSFKPAAAQGQESPGGPLRETGGKAESQCLLEETASGRGQSTDKAHLKPPGCWCKDGLVGALGCVKMAHSAPLTLWHKSTDLRGQKDVCLLPLMGGSIRLWLPRGQRGGRVLWGWFALCFSRGKDTGPTISVLNLGLETTKPAASVKSSRVQRGQWL